MDWKKESERIDWIDALTDRWMASVPLDLAGALTRLELRAVRERLDRMAGDLWDLRSDKIANATPDAPECNAAPDCGVCCVRPCEGGF